jgi:hypothetical protein
MIDYLHDKIAEYVERIGDPGKTLEIGSYDVNGGVAHLFTDYTGTDMREGPGVDLVVNSHDLLKYFPPRSFNTIVWLETMEHDSAFWLTMGNINQLIKPNGYLMMSAPTIGYEEHRHPQDYWRFTEDAFHLLLDGWDICQFDTFENSWEGVNVTLSFSVLAQRPEIPSDQLAAANERIAKLENQIDYLMSKIEIRGEGVATGTVRHEA